MAETSASPSVTPLFSTTAATWSVIRTNSCRWLVLNQSHFTPTNEDGKFGDALLPWEKFSAVWDECLNACKAGMQGGDCGYNPMGKAEGGKLDMMLRVRGAGLALRFRQVGAPPNPEPVKKPVAELMDGVKGKKPVPWGKRIQLN